MKYSMFARRRIPAALSVMAVALLIAIPATPALAAVAGDQAGVFADGAIDYAFFPCFSLSCDGAFGNLDSQQRGALGSHGPAIVSGFATGGTGTASFDARSLIVGAHALPQLHAVARATPGVGPHDGFSGEVAYFFNSTASAQAHQYFSCLGSTEQTYTLRCTFDGYTENADPDKDRDALVYVSAGLALHNDKNNSLELPMGRLVDISQSNVNGSAGSFNTVGEVSITLDPGNAFYLSAYVNAGVGRMGWGIADAGNTLSVAFTAGDTAQLVPLLAPVPEPSRAALWMLGFVVLWSARRLRAGGASSSRQRQDRRVPSTEARIRRRSPSNQGSTALG